MNRQYNNYLNRLQELINSKADTYEESILYQIEIVDYNLLLGKIEASYDEILKKFYNIKNKYSEKNFPNIFNDLNSIGSIVNYYNERLFEYKEEIYKASSLNYDNLVLEFQNNVNLVNQKLADAKGYLDNYNRYSYQLKELSIDDVNYDTINNKKNGAKNNFYDVIRDIPTYLNNLEELLIQGLLIEDLKKASWFCISFLLFSILIMW